MGNPSMLKKSFYHILSVTIFTLLLFFQTTISFAQNNYLVSKKRQLDQLQVKIKSLEQKLRQSANKNKFLENELTETNKQIDAYYLKIKTIQKDIDAKKQEIASLKILIQKLNTKLEKTQKQIAKYIVEQYKAHDTTKLKLILNQKNIDKGENILIYYKYLLAANKKLLNEFKSNQEELNNKNSELNNSLKQLQNLQTQWNNVLNKLQADKKYKTTVINKLSLNINKSKKTLQDYRQNQINLTKLINNLTKQSVLQTKSSVMQMQGKLPKPINVAPSQIKRMNQGLVFYAPEGRVVHAVSPGKVVFADWLNGYGLLIIIDHGWGVMSLYANNLQLLKRSGQVVTSGEKIAKIGHSGVLQENGLYFEIRHHGKAMPPEKWLHQ